MIAVVSRWMTGGYFILCLALMQIAGCHHVPRISDYQFLGEAVSTDDTQRISIDLSARLGELAPQRMLTQCVLTHGSEHFGLRYAFVAAPSGELRIEQFPPTSFYAITTLVSNTEGATVLIPAEKRALLFPRGEEGIRQIFGISVPLDESDIGPLLQGILPERFQQEPIEFRYQSVETPREIALRTATSLAYFTQGYALRELHLFEKGSQDELLQLSLDYDAESRPASFVLVFPQEGAELSCRVQQRSKDATIPAHLFSLEIPADYEVVNRRE